LIDKYLEIIKGNGFENITVQKQKPILLPDDILTKYLNAQELIEFKKGQSGIFSITVYAEKPIAEKSACCDPGCCN
jgi:hypothetical protein